MKDPCIRREEEKTLEKSNNGLKCYTRHRKNSAFGKAKGVDMHPNHYPDAPGLSPEDVLSEPSSAKEDDPCSEALGPKCDDPCSEAAGVMHNSEAPGPNQDDPSTGALGPKCDDPLSEDAGVSLDDPRSKDGCVNQDSEAARPSQDETPSPMQDDDMPKANNVSPAPLHSEEAKLNIESGIVLGLEAPNSAHPDLPTETDKPQTPASATAGAVAAQTPGAVAAQTPRRYPSLTRISAVRNFPNGCGKDSKKSSSCKKDRIKNNRASKASKNSSRKRKREQESSDGDEAIEQDDDDSFSQGSVMDVSNGVEDITDARRRVLKGLSLFEKIYKKLVQDEASETEKSKQRVQTDMLAFKLFNQQGMELNSGRFIGSVPGVDVGDEFNLRVELCIVGLHRIQRHCIDVIDQRGKMVAISVVHMNANANGSGWSADFVYSTPGDLKIEGNQALSNNIDTQTPVRVILGFKGYQSSNSRATRAKRKIATYIYGGLYLVTKYWRKKGDDGHYACMFQFKRIPGQPELVMRGTKGSSLSKACPGQIIQDISKGKEKIPINVVNTIDNEHPKPFTYVTKNIYPPQHPLLPPRGCDCTGRCSDSESCACAVRNGGEIPFNDNGDIVEAKPLVYECGPSCKCPPSCHNRVSQRGLKFKLEVFKTESRGWGVRSRERIPTGSFICEYTGELMDDQVADRRDNDEYLFDIGDNYYDEALWEGLNTKIPDLQKGASREGEEGSFAVDASEYGSVGRFINHSCTPNLYAQNVLYDHDNKSMPHVILFAVEDIPPLQELTYDYNYAIDQVRDSNGNIKKKVCYCGTADCTGWLY